MKLTNAIKDSIINAVMQDTPEEFTFDQYNDASQKIAENALPKDVWKVYKNKETKSYISTRYYNGLYIPKPDHEVVIPEIDALRAKWKASEGNRKTLRAHIKNVVYQFNTDKQMLAHIPEFEKYLPKEVQKTENLPATNMIAELVAAGWPKSK